MRTLLSGIVVVSIALVFSPTAEAQRGGQNPGLRASDGRVAPQSPDNRYIIEFHRFGPDAAAAVRAAGGLIVYEFPEYSAVAAYVSQRGLAALAGNANVRNIEVDPRRYPMGAPSAEPRPTALWSDTTSGGETTPYGIQMVRGRHGPGGRCQP